MASKTTKKQQTKKETKKATKTTTATTKATKAKKEKVQPVEEHIGTPAVTTPAKPRKKQLNKITVTLVIIIIVLAIAYAFRNAFIVATVNGKPISRSDYEHELQKDAGKQAMNELVTKTLIYQEAEKNHVTISNDDVNKEIKKVEDTLKQQHTTLDEALKQRDLTRQDLEDQIRIKMIVDKLVGSKIVVTDKEVNDYIDKNKDTLPENERDNPSAATKATIKQQLVSNKLNVKFQEWLDNLQTKAKINYLVNY